MRFTFLFCWIGGGMLGLILALVTAPAPKVTLQQMLEVSVALPQPELPVMIQLVDSPEDWGTCDRKNGHFVVNIHEDLDPLLAIEMLMHEWAHCLSWDDEVKDGDHSAAWGVSYAECYRALFQETP